MADLVVTAANVIAGTNASKSWGIALAAVTAGQVVYLDATTGKFGLADNNGVAATQVPFGIALNNAAAGQPLCVQTKGPCTIGATLTPGTAYYLSATPGGICPVADLATGMKPSALGIATSASVLDINIEQSGVTL